MAGIFKRASRDMQFLFRDPKELTPKGMKRKRRAKKTVVGLFFVLIQVILTLLCVFRVISLEIFPMRYILIASLVLIAFTFYTFVSQFTRAHTMGRFISILLSIVMLFGFLFSSKIASTLDKLSGNTKTDVIDVVVLAKDSAKSIPDTLSYTFGSNSTVNTSVISEAITKIQQENKTAIATKSFDNWDLVVNALYNNIIIQALLVNDSMIGVLQDEFPDFDKKTKIVGQIEITTQVALSTSDKKVNSEPFVVYISGNDEYGTVSANGRSDVNIIAVVNPVSRQIVLISTPRDYYITIQNADGKSGLDKLTHAGNAGIDYSVMALENLYETKIDYFVKINFTGCINVVDALGGITIISDVDFTNGQDAAPESYHFVVGPNECDGAKTLAFVRERQAFGNGDFQRGRNQSAAISAIIDKATSPVTLMNYGPLLNAISNMMLTNMPGSSITALIKGELNSSTNWNVQSYAVEGEPAFRDCTVYGLSGKSVVLPDYGTVDIAKRLIEKIVSGEVFNVETYIKAITSEAK